MLESSSIVRVSGHMTFSNFVHLNNGRVGNRDYGLFQSLGILHASYQAGGKTAQNTQQHRRVDKIVNNAKMMMAQKFDGECGEMRR